MGKHLELATPDASEAPEKTARELLDDSIAHLQGLQRAAEATTAREHCGKCGGVSSPALLRESANIGRAISAISAELRQRDKHEREFEMSMAGTDLDELITEYLCELPRERRMAIRQQVDERTSDDHLLSH